MRKTGSRSSIPHMVVLLGAVAFTSSILRAGGTEPIGAVRVDAPISIPNNQGDTWAGAWAADGSVYSPSNDTKGFRNRGSSNIAFNRLAGDDPGKIEGVSINMMTDYGKSAEQGPDGCSWKSSGCYALDGVIYWVVARHKYGETSGAPQKRQTAADASIIKSTDLGKTWTRSVQENYNKPMFPGRRFAAPYFVQYGQDGRGSVDNADRHVYAISNDGFWDNGNSMILGRAARSKIAHLNAADWEFYVGGNGMEDVAWTQDIDKARLVLEAPGKLGMTGSVYLPGLKRYFMIGWYYPAGGGKLNDEARKKTVWDFYEAAKPWGPWTKIGSKEFEPQGYYSPQICPKFTSDDGRRVFAFTAGNWKDSSVYRLTVVPLRLEAAQSRPGGDR